MARSQGALRLTEIYRRRFLSLRQRAEATAKALWDGIDQRDLDGTYPLEGLVNSVAAIQREEVRAAGAYLIGFISLELGHRVRTPPLDALPYIVSRDGRPLEESLRSPLVAIKGEIGEGRTPEEALKLGLDRAVRTVGVEVDNAGRASLSDAMAKDPRVEGWRRAVRGTCGACLGLADDALAPPGAPLHIHPFCQCIAEPVIRGVSDAVPRPSGKALFAAMTAAQKAAAVGSDLVPKVESGEVSLKELVAVSALATQADFITQKPAQDLN